MLSKEFNVMCISKHIVYVQKVQNMIILKKFIVLRILSTATQKHATNHEGQFMIANERDRVPLVNLERGYPKYNRFLINQNLGFSFALIVPKYTRLQSCANMRQHYYNLIFCLQKQMLYTLFIC